MDNKSCLKAITLELRRELEGKYDAQGAWQPGDLERRLAAIGVRRDRAPVPVGELSHLSAGDREARRVIDAFLESRAEAGLGREAAIGEFVREAAYSWANRLLALRCMEARGLIDEVILQKAAYGGRSLQHNRLAKKEPDRCAGEDEGLFALLFDEFGRRATELPLLFNPAAPEVVLRPSVPAIKQCIGLLSGTVVARGQEAASDEVFTGPDALGWAYQYWNIEEKDRVFAAASGKGPDRKKHKIEGADIVPATCFYTDSYMVQFLVQNSLGALWMGMRPESRLSEGWAYYVKDADRAPGVKKAVAEVTFLDPACGSGHFLIEAFDLFYAMYVEEGVTSEPGEICASILAHNLFGIDIDERAVQFAALALVLKAKEKAPDFVPRQVNVVATNIRLPAGRGHLDAFLAAHPEDAPLKPALVAIFEGLAHADELGSLLQIEEPVEKELRALKAQYEASKTAGPKQQVLLAEFRAPVQGELPLGVESYEAWKARTLARLRAHFDKEAGAADLGAAFFGEAAVKGLSLVDLLTRRYDVVAANPPYMGSKNMGIDLRQYVDRHFEAGKRDLYAAFILRCRELCADGGRIAVVAQQSWMFLRSYRNLRALDVNELKRNTRVFGGMLRDMAIETLAHLGRYAFSDIGNAAVAPAMFAARKGGPSSGHRLWACRLTAPRPSEQQASLLRAAANGELRSAVSRSRQQRFLSIPESPLSYWLSESLFDLLAGQTLGSVASVCQGLATADDSRFLRFVWETPLGQWAHKARERRWVLFEKGGGYGKWFGHHFWTVDWGNLGARIKATPGPRVQNEQHYFKECLTYSYMAQGSLGVRSMSDSIFAHKSPAIIVGRPASGEMAISNCRLASAVVRAIGAALQLPEGCVARIPVPVRVTDALLKAEHCCVDLKRRLVDKDLTESTFAMLPSGRFDSIGAMYDRATSEVEVIGSTLLALEGWLEEHVLSIYSISEDDLEAILRETGRPAGWNSLILGYGRAPELGKASVLWGEYSVSARKIASFSFPDERVAEVKVRLRELYGVGPGSINSDAEIDDFAADDDENGEEAEHSGAHIPIPAETFLEELSQKLEIHPISVYWLLRELREKEGVVCLPELRRFIEDHFSVLILRLLGHRWPKQIEANEPLPSWVDDDGVIPLSEGTDEPTLLARLRDRIAEDFGAERVTAIEQEFREIMGKPLAEWITADFFKRHISQFKKRPIAWQIESRPVSGDKRRGKGAKKTAPVFSCLVYYHRLDQDLLPKLRTQYVGPLRSRLQTEQRGLEKLEKRSSEQEGRKVELGMKIEELQTFDARLDDLSRSAFSSPALDTLLVKEPLDPWTSRDGEAPAPATRDTLVAQERRYDPDINDGVRVNVAPLQKAGLLAAEVLASKDLDKAIADRAEWRADERRWCREKKLPRPGWWTAQEPDPSGSPS